MSAHRVYNFSAGPAMLPTEVLEKAQAEMLDWNGTGMSVMEISHRSDAFKQVAEDATHTLRELLNVPNNYHILFLHGGARSQFAMVPMNILNGAKKAAYIQTGVWSDIAIAEAQKYADVEIICDAKVNDYTHIPDVSSWKTVSDAAYLYYVDNETVHGVEFPFIPEANGLPLVSDMSSNLLSRKFDVSQYGIVFACAQKNLGPAGVTIVIVRDDLLNREKIPDTPSMFDYTLQAEKHSMLNTSPTYPWYLCGLVLQWVKAQGGVKEMEARAAQRAQLLYNFIDQSDFYSNRVDPSCRSRMNVIFKTPNEALDKQFVEQATQAGLTGLKGHRFLGGLRASMYNAMPVAGAEALLNFMDDFAKTHA